MINKRIATVTVTYNRKELLLQNIQAIMNQDYDIEAIIIVDNHSTDNTQEEVLKKFNSDKIKYLYLEENTGGAGGFYEGCKYAYENGYDWIILMDDDGRLQNSETVKRLMEAIERENLTADDKVMYNSLVLGDDENLSFSLIGLHDKKSYIESVAESNILPNKINPFNGTLVSKGLVKEIGYPNKDFFISCDEQEFQARAKNANAHIATVVNSLYFHPKFRNPEIREFKIFGKQFQLFLLNPPFKEYYFTRNKVYMYRKNNNKKELLKYKITKILSLLLIKNENKKEIRKMVKKGFKDGNKGILGRTVELK